MTPLETRCKRREHLLHLGRGDAAIRWSARPPPQQLIHVPQLGCELTFGTQGRLGVEIGLILARTQVGHEFMDPGEGL